MNILLHSERLHRALCACARAVTATSFFVLGASQGALATQISINTELVTGGLADPVGVVHAGDDSGRLFIVEQGGTIKIFSGGALLPTPFLDISARVSCCGERGLLGLAFHPGYATNGFFFVNYTNVSGATVIARYRSLGNPDVANPGTERILLTISQPFANHNGGNMAFGPDGFLYIGTGDGGSGGNPFGNGQSLQTLLGKILRLDVNNPPDFIPLDNPFVGDPQALDEIWAYGVRNPWRFSFDRDTGDLFIGDVGQNATEEVNFQPAASFGGENYGWNVLEGTSCFSDDPPGSCNDFLNGDSTLPIVEYDHSGGNCSITGGFRYRGLMFPSLVGTYFFADYCSGRIWGATEDMPGAWSVEELLDTGFSISSFGEDEDGEIYLTRLSPVGEVYHIVGTDTGGGVPCSDVRNFFARCQANGRLQAAVLLTDVTHDGDTVTLDVDGQPQVLTVRRRLAVFQMPGATSGVHVISLEDPAACFPDAEATCP